MESMGVEEPTIYIPESSDLLQQGNEISKKKIILVLYSFIATYLELMPGTVLWQEHGLTYAPLTPPALEHQHLLEPFGRQWRQKP